MKKIPALFLALCLLLPLSALADDVQVDVWDFFITLNSDAPHNVYEKTEGGFILRHLPAKPDGSRYPQLDVIWSGESMDLDAFTDGDIAACGEKYKNDLVALFNENDVKVKDDVIEYCGIASLDRKALRIDISLAAYDARSRDMYFRYYLVPVDGGMITFMIIALDQESIGMYVEPLLRTIEWK